MKILFSQLIEELQDLDDIAQKVLPHLADVTTFALCGALGSGKTAFTRSLLHAMGSADAVSSPSFVLQHEYKSAEGRTIEHWDLYRLKSLPAELAEPAEDNALRIIEWADKFQEVLNASELILEIEFPLSDSQKRVFKLSALD